MLVKTIWDAANDKGLGLSHRAPTLFLVFDADPKMTWHDGAVWADGKFSKFDLFFASIQHAGMYKANVRCAPEFLAVIIHCLLDFDAQCGMRVIVKP